MLNYVLKKVLGTKNERELKKIRPLVSRINELEPRMKALAECGWLRAWDQTQGR